MKLAVVTGGCRRLGGAIASRLAREGYALALHASNDAEPDADLRDALSEAGAEWAGFTADLADEQAVEALLPAIADRFGQAPALLVNSAARFGQDRPESTDYGELLGHYAVNCAAPAVLSRSLATLGGETIVNILDQRIAAPHGDQLAYTLSKIALAGLTRILARELAPEVRVNAVAPGLTLPTPDYDASRLAKAAAAMPLEHLPDPDEIADAVVWLADAEAVTGQTVFVDGGAHLRTFARDFLYLD